MRRLQCLKEVIKLKKGLIFSLYSQSFYHCLLFLVHVTFVATIILYHFCFCLSTPFLSFYAFKLLFWYLIIISLLKCLNIISAFSLSVNTFFWFFKNFFNFFISFYNIIVFFSLVLKFYLYLFSIYKFYQCFFQYISFLTL